jgi:hypothetical protein
MTKVDHHLQVIPSAASPEEGAAIVAALERFMRATAPPPSQPAGAPNGWRHTALLEGVSRDPWGDASSPVLGNPWINT